MSEDFLLPGWKERIETAHRSTVASTPMPRPPLARPWLMSSVHFVQTVEEADALVQTAYENPVSWIGMDTEYRFEHADPIHLRRGVEWRDIRSIRPFCIAFAIVSGESVIRFVVDLRKPELGPHIQKVLDLHVAFATHHAKSEEFVFSSLGLRAPRIIWDTFIAELALRLGTSVARRKVHEADDDVEAIRFRQVADAEDADSLKLDHTAARYGVAIVRPRAKAALQGSFLTKAIHAPLEQIEIEYCSSDAELAAAIRAPQRAACDRAGILGVLDQVIMPWVQTAAEMEWNGVNLDREKCQALLDGSARARKRIATELVRHGIANPNSTQQLAQLLKNTGLDRHFPKTSTGQPCTSDSVLEARERMHPAIPVVRQWRKLRQLSSDPAILGEIRGCDGRVHAEFRVLGADTGRTQARRPNLMGLGKVFRPLVCASENFGLGEVDLTQVEVGIGGGLFFDRNLIADFNSGDVYAAMAQRMFANELSLDDQKLDCQQFKKKHPKLRGLAKPLVLGIVYGKGIPSLALDLKLSRREAQTLWDSFRSLYPALCNGMERARADSAHRGYAYFLGLRRFLVRPGSATPHQKRALGNACIQGSAAVVFFDAGNRLRRLYHRHGARLIIPVHDAFVFEAPINHMREVAELTRSVLIQTVQEWFPELQPRADVNILHPACWNHEGHHDSVERFLEDPMLVL